MCAFEIWSQSPAFLHYIYSPSCIQRDAIMQPDTVCVCVCVGQIHRRDASCTESLVWRVRGGAGRRREWMSNRTTTKARERMNKGSEMRQKRKGERQKEWKNKNTGQHDSTELIVHHGGARCVKPELYWESCWTVVWSRQDLRLCLHKRKYSLIHSSYLASLTLLQFSISVFTTKRSSKLAHVLTDIYPI